MNRKEVLQKTKQLLIDEGWCQGSFDDGDGGRCVVRALQAVTHEYGDAYWAILSCTSPNFRSLVSFNDHPSTTRADVFAAIDKAIGECG